MKSSQLAALVAATVTLAQLCMPVASGQGTVPNPRVQETRRSSTVFRQIGTGRKEAEMAGLAKRRRAILGIAALLNESRSGLLTPTPTETQRTCPESGPSFFDQYRCPGDVYFAPLATSQCPETALPTCNSSTVTIGMLCKSPLPSCKDSRGRDPWVWPTCFGPGPNMFRKRHRDSAVILISGCFLGMCHSWLLPPNPDFANGRCVSPVMFNDGDVGSIHSGSMRMSCSPNGNVQVTDFPYEACQESRGTTNFTLTREEARNLFRGLCTAGSRLTGNIGSAVPPAC